MKNGSVIIAIATLLGACAGDSLEESQVIVDSQPTACVGAAQSLCLRVKHREEQQWDWHYGGISGFDYAWGYNYVISYVENEIEDPPADGSSTEWVLLDVVSRTEDPVGTEYDFNGVSLQESTITFANDEYTFIGYPFVCAEGLDCDTLLMLSGSEQDVDLQFRYLGDTQIELVSWQ